MLQTPRPGSKGLPRPPKPQNLTASAWFQQPLNQRGTISPFHLLWFHPNICSFIEFKCTQSLYLYRPAGRRADQGGGAHGRGRGEAALPLLLIDAVALGLWELQEVLHGPQVDQQRLGRRLGVFLLTQDLRQQTLQEETGGGCQINTWSCDVCFNTFLYV